jgi:hypothetical protein
MKEIKRRDAIIENNPASLLDCDTVLNELETELDTV